MMFAFIGSSWSISWWEWVRSLWLFDMLILMYIFWSTLDMAPKSQSKEHVGNWWFGPLFSHRGSNWSISWREQVGSLRLFDMLILMYIFWSTLDMAPKSQSKGHVGNWWFGPFFSHRGSSWSISWRKWVRSLWLFDMLILMYIFWSTLDMSPKSQSKDHIGNWWFGPLFSRWGSSWSISWREWVGSLWLFDMLILMYIFWSTLDMAPKSQSKDHIGNWWFGPLFSHRGSSWSMSWREWVRSLWLFNMLILMYIFWSTLDMAPESQSKEHVRSISLGQYRTDSDP
jgi:hypothetical protein